MTMTPLRGGGDPLLCALKANFIRGCEPALVLAQRLQFEGGQPVLGYASLREYVAVDNPKAGRALELGFVHPVTVIHAVRSHASGEPPTSGSPWEVARQALAADGAGAPGEPEAKN